MLSSHTVKKRDNNNAVINILKLAYTQKNSNVFAYMLRLTYNIHTYIAKARLSFCAHTNRRDAVNRLIFRIFRPIYTQRNHTQSSNSTLFTRWAHIRHTHIYCEDTIQLLRTYTSMQCSKSVGFLIFWSIYMHRNHIHCKDTTQSLLIYTERQQRLCARAATHIRHTHIHCEGTTQLLRIYTSAWCSKSIDFSLYQVDLHASQSHTLRRHDIVFAHIHRTTATSLTHIHHTHTYCEGTTQLLRIYTLAWCSKLIDFSIFWVIYMHRKHIHCKDMTQSLLIYTERQQRLCARAATNIRHLHSHCKDTTQLLHTYTSVQRSKLINFDFLIDLHASQIHRSKLI